MTTARDFLIGAGFDDSDENLSSLTRYLGNRVDYLSFPDANAVTEDGDVLSSIPDEPAAFQEWMMDQEIFILEMESVMDTLRGETVEDLREDMESFEAYIGAHPDISLGELLAAYYIDELKYTTAETSKRLCRDSKTIRSQYTRYRSKGNIKE